jgi:cell division protein FtsL
MTALPLETPARIRNPRTARSAAQRRLVRNQRSHYAVHGRIALAVMGALVVLLSYVLLTSNITALSYALERADEQRTELQMQSARLDDEIATLTSDDRLAAVAAKLGMVEPSQFLRVSVAPAPWSPEHPLAFLGNGSSPAR